MRNLIAAEEQARGKPYTAEERGKRVAELQAALTRIGTNTDPLRQEARRLVDAGNVAGGQAKLDEALDADEKALAEEERVAAERRKALARNARDAAVLARGSDVLTPLTLRTGTPTRVLRWTRGAQRRGRQRSSRQSRPPRRATTHLRGTGPRKA